MYEVIVNTKKGMKVSRHVWVSSECSIGRANDNQIILQGWRVSKNHASLFMSGDGAHIVTHEGGGSVVVNGNKTNKYGPINTGDVIEIGDYRIDVKKQKKEHGHTESRSSENANGLRITSKEEQSIKELAEVSAQGNITNKEQLESTNKIIRFELTEMKESAGDLFVDQNYEETPSELMQRKRIESWRSKVHKSLFEILDLRRINLGDMSDLELREFTQKSIVEIISKIKDLPEDIDSAELIRQVLDEAIGLGPLEVLLERDDISEIMVNAYDQIYVEQKGKIKKSRITFTNDAAVLSAIERIVSPLGRRIDESSPLVDARLKDGSRVNAVIPPLALKGPCITIRKFTKERLKAQHLINFGSISLQMVKFLETAIVQKRNIVISGGTGSGKTTLLNVMSNFIPSNERIVTVEDAAELQLIQPNLVSLEARAQNQEGKGEVSIRALVKNCLRMRPDRIVIGECRGGEALDMLQAMNTGHDGSLTTVHSNSPRDCISRLEVLTMMSGMDLPLKAIRDQISSAVHIIVQQTRFSCGSRRVTSITEVTGMEGEVIQLAEIFKFHQQGFDSNGKVIGSFVPTGLVPEFYEDLKRRGIPVDINIFKEEKREF